MVVLIVNHCLVGPREAKNVMDVGEIKGLHHLNSPHLSQTMGLRATGAHYQWLPQFCLGLTGWTDPNVPEEVDDTERMELT